jgi:integrase
VATTTAAATVVEESDAYRNFINSIGSEATRRNYRYMFSYFMAFCKETSYDDMVGMEPERLEGVIRDYIIHLKQDKKRSQGTVSAYISAIRHFYDMNDIDLHWKKIAKFKGRQRSVVEDKPYTRQQIKTLLDGATLRDKCFVFLMCSAGLRRGALPGLRLKDLQKIDKYQLYKISVYKNEQEYYVTFCTPECARYIDRYLDWRQRLGEQLKPNSPLLRISFDAVTQPNVPKPVSIYVVNSRVRALLERTGVRPAQETYQRTELMLSHGFRKFFKTTCINADMNPLYSEYVMGHRSGLTKSYFKPTDQELLEGNDKALGYVAAVNDLTINEEHRLTKKVNELQLKNDQILELERQHKKDLKTVQNQVAQMMQMIRQEPRLTKIKP